MKYANLALTLVLLAGGARIAGAQDAGDATRGLAFVQNTCSECHDVRRGQLNSPNSAAPPFQIVANVPGMTELALRTALRSTHKTMPNIMLTEAQLADVVAYILSLHVDR